MKQIETLLRRRIGLDPNSIGRALIQRNVRLRIKTLGLPDLDAYKALLCRSTGEWRELVETLIVAETWFFREPGAFEAAGRFVREELEGRAAHSPLRILSLPCSTGEEPYSLAMALLDAGITPEAFRIEAVDLSSRALERARTAIYGPNSFRGKDLTFRDAHFVFGREGHALERRVRDCVQFRQGNILDNRLPGAAHGYDCIFCRNLLIYFDRNTQRLALQQLNRLLKSGGVLFVGAAEMPLVEGNLFSPAGLPQAFAWQKPEDETHSKKRVRAGKNRAPFAPSHAPRNSPAKPSVCSANRTTPRSLSEAPTTNCDFGLGLAKRLVEDGRLAEATAICEEAIRQSRTCAQAYFVLGLVYDATGSASALDCYRKALYLQPEHYETLLRMAALSEKSGELACARRYHLRARRARTPELSTL